MTINACNGAGLQFFLQVMQLPGYYLFTEGVYGICAFGKGFEHHGVPESVSPLLSLMLREEP